MTTHLPTRHSKLISAAILTGAAVATLGAAAGASARADADATGAAAPALPAAPCAAADLEVEATMDVPEENIVSVAVSHATYVEAACTIDAIPTITFGDLDGSARAIDDSSGGQSLLEPGETAHAALRTAPGMDADGAGLVQDITVAAAAGHAGTTISADELGAGEPGVYVYDPITTRWQQDRAEAIEQIRDQLP